MRIKTYTVAGATLAATLMAGVAGTASAADAGTAGAAPARSVAQASYSDRDVVDFLVFGQGQAATAHPELARQIRDRRGDTSVTDAQLSSLVQGMQQADPEYHARVTEAVQSKDPFVVQQGMVSLNEDLKGYIATNSGANTLDSASIARPNGWVWTKSNIVTVANVAAAINVAGATNVAGFAEVAVVVVIVPAAASYGFDLQQPDQLDENNLVAAVASAL
ncbi:sporulation delaying protein family toxin [Kitasatospora sp. NPDC094015]|uniref:sporulation delaying protein family toxin n=1 Tax=Kitasatospora sp. NPDC094015 TaxID=3155205 RepID=UPI00332626CB